MSTKIICEGNEVLAELSGELDHHNAPAIRELIDDYLEKNHPQSLILDFDKVSFMDSSGIGLVMGRYKLISSFNGSVECRNLSSHAYKVMRLSGIEKIAKIRKKREEKQWKL